MLSLPNYFNATFKSLVLAPISVKYPILPLQMLTVKQEQLLHQLEAFDLECETMREQLEAARDSSSTTTHELSDVVKQKRMLHSENTRLQVTDRIRKYCSLIG